LEERVDQKPIKVAIAWLEGLAAASGRREVFKVLFFILAERHIRGRSFGPIRITERTGNRAIAGDIGGRTDVGSAKGWIRRPLKSEFVQSRGLVLEGKRECQREGDVYVIGVVQLDAVIPMGFCFRRIVAGKGLGTRAPLDAGVVWPGAEESVNEAAGAREDEDEGPDEGDGEPEEAAGGAEASVRDRRFLGTWGHIYNLG
jgi:hypothetical protein